jgi:hypothetical protein
MSIPTTTDSRHSAKPNRKRTLLAIVIVVVVLAAVAAYVLTPPLTVTVSGSVSVKSAYQVMFETSNSFQISAAVNNVGSYSITLPNQHSYDVFVSYTSPGGGPGLVDHVTTPCGTLLLYQSTKLGPYHFDVSC